MLFFLNKGGNMEKDFSKYDPKNAPVKKFGGNDAIHDGVRTEQTTDKATKRDKPQDQRGV
jgi:hypothetical protein